MNNSKINKIIFTMVGLTAFSGVLFAYDNFYLSDSIKNEIIYVAKQDIPAKTKLKESMFEAVVMPSNGLLPTYVTDLKEIEGKQLKGGLLKSEPLSKNRLAKETDLAHNLQIKIQTDETSLTVKDNDYINMYVVLNNNGETKVRKVFDSKQVSVITETTVEATTTTITINVNESEVTKYLTANEQGKIVLVKNNDIDANTNILDYDPNSEEAKNSVKDDKKDDENTTEQITPNVSVITKKFEEGDTLEDLSIKYKTSVENIQKLNNKKEFNVGDEIILPAN